MLAPLWHAEKSPERVKKTCDAVPTFEQHAAAVDKEAPADAARAAAAHTAAQGLIAAVGELKAECAKPEAGRADFEAKFGAVHEAFHKVMEARTERRPRPWACSTGVRRGTLTPTPLPEGEGLGTARIFPSTFGRGDRGVRSRAAAC